MALKDAVATVLNRNVFYRDGYRLLLRISIVQGIILILLVASIVVMLMSTETRYIYFATTSDGRIIKIEPLSAEYKSRAEVTTWAARSVQDVMRFGYNDYRQRLQQSASNFTPTGWESFTKAMKEARVLEAVEARKLVVSLDIESAPEIKAASVRDGVFTWYLQFPITIKFDGNEPPAPIHALLILQIVRVSTLVNPEGISIEQWIARSDK
jgi:intracellular multiplication protein IcmL